MICLLLPLVFLSCKKDKATHKVPELAGDWIAAPNQHAPFESIFIAYNSKGSLNEKANGDGSREFRKWYIKKDCLYYGWISGSSFVINQYPVIAEQDIFDRGDTIHAGERYAILNYTYYIDRTLN